MLAEFCYALSYKCKMCSSWGQNNPEVGTLCEHPLLRKSFQSWLHRLG